ncbi:hypothetical protein BABINDRAFT_176253 [Babjeviella inositovora NRRL Y-12698]|uniref:Bacteriophage T5 Orf172 DNA-binding domain-containing protein n=1 Tax=Babjeviella inositovora NRRL Y-12698 TaxID=984486 RepID=A0A1E3QNT2_9ASCO|nr:uncharacterized protein BABINDRAFT_176253 [Babjeviella inositovora NRRL Y-12698]ODQ79335.1 hypothetical protein BABINDRAFT_176253 [Babjeviella inositovora NRRL Y-12698]
MLQCKGTTKKGLRCKIAVQPPNTFCHYHVPQPQYTRHFTGTFKTTSATGSGTSTPPKSRYNTTGPVLAPVKKPGHIYIYTLAHLLDPSPRKEAWLKVVKDRNAKESWVDFNPKRHILIKVGFTTQFPVQKRLTQWENKCGHRLSPIEPHVRNYERKTTLLKLFSKLSIKPSEVSEGSFRTYDISQKAFHCDSNVNIVESHIHKLLRQKYGSGDVLCSGCTNDPTVLKRQDRFNVHVEWFQIKRTDFDDVFQTVDRCCSLYGQPTSKFT